MRALKVLLFCGLTLFGSSVSAQETVTPSKAVAFAKTIRPVLVAHCSLSFAGSESGERRFPARQVAAEFCQRDQSGALAGRAETGPGGRDAAEVESAPAAERGAGPD